MSGLRHAYYSGLVAILGSAFCAVAGRDHVASEFRYRDAPFAPKGLAIFVSPSGETDDPSDAALRQGQSSHVLYLIVNVPEFDARAKATP